MSILTRRRQPRDTATRSDLPGPAEAPLAITFTGDAWEWMYRFLADAVEQWPGLCVGINGMDCELLRIEGDPHTPPATLFVRRYDPAQYAYVDPEVAIPLFHDDGNCAITHIHVL